jgi:hypothetical protein
MVREQQTSREHQTPSEKTSTPELVARVQTTMFVQRLQRASSSVHRIPSSQSQREKRGHQPSPVQWLLESDNPA